MRNLLLLVALIIFTSCSTISNYFELETKNEQVAETDKSCRLVKHYKEAKYCVYQKDKQMTAWNDKDKARRSLSSLKDKKVCP